MEDFRNTTRRKKWRLRRAPEHRYLTIPLLPTEFYQGDALLVHYLDKVMAVALLSPTQFMLDFNSKGWIDSLEALGPFTLALRDKSQAMHADEAFHNPPSEAKAARKFALVLVEVKEFSARPTMDGLTPPASTGPIGSISKDWTVLRRMGRPPPSLDVQTIAKIAILGREVRTAFHNVTGTGSIEAGKLNLCVIG